MMIHGRGHTLGFMHVGQITHFSIIPSKNLISNIGFNKSATNTKFNTDDIVYIPKRRNFLKQ